MYEIHLSKEAFKFSCSHFTILAPERAERLHGHNYQLRVDIQVPDLDKKLGMAFEFSSVKPVIRALCETMDERILLPQNSLYLKIQAAKPQVHVQFGQKHYSFPEEDTLLLPIANITSEELARFAGEHLVEALKNVSGWAALRVHVEETRGQSVSYFIKR